MTFIFILTAILMPHLLIQRQAKTHQTSTISRRTRMHGAIRQGIDERRPLSFEKSLARFMHFSIEVE